MADAPAPEQEAQAAQLAAAVSAGHRAALARAITLCESTRADHRAQARAVLRAVRARTGKAVRLGLTGAPGVGKSTFIEALGTRLTGDGHKVAVLAVDPSSARSGGSILGDKTRMQKLAADPRAFIRPSPSSGALGGVAPRTAEAMLLAEAAGYDVVIIETVGVGQSEAVLAGLVDVFVLLIAPGGGDELQGMKRGIVELADLIVVNKADGDLKPTAETTAASYRAALTLTPARSGAATPEVLLASARDGTGLDEVWAAVLARCGALQETGALDERRARVLDLLELDTDGDGTGARAS